MSTLAFAILGLLAVRPCTGYDVAQRMRAPIGWMWSAQHSQIYPELARLLDARLVTSTVIPGRGPRDTKRYAITDEGLRRLATWADSPLAPEVPRSELLLRVRSLWLTSPDRAIAFVAAQRDECRQRIAVLEAEREEFAPDDVASWDHPEYFAFASLQHGLVRARATASWFDWLLDQLQRQRRGERGSMLTTPDPGPKREAQDPRPHPTAARTEEDR